MATTIQWPKAIRETPIQQNIEKMFRAADDPSDPGGESFAECFMPTGELVARGNVCKGHEGES